jgi:F-box domain.
MNINIYFQTMKRTTNQRNSGHEEERMDPSERSEEIYRIGRMTSASPYENIRYSLRSRNIFYRKKQEALTVVNNVSEVQNSALLKTNNIAQTFRNTPTEKTAVEPSSKADTFTQQQQASKYITDSTNDNFTSDPSIMMLPNEILVMIFSYLDVHELSTSVAPVCKRWHSIAHSPILWRKLCFEGDGVSTEFAKRLITKSPQLSELIISDR